MDSGATFSPCKKYRYSLWRIWDTDKPLLGFCMLNPSTAGESENDPTIERCCCRARHLGFGGIIVTNIFAYRSTDPKNLKTVEDPVGPDNNARITERMWECHTMICGWGKHGSYLGRGQEVLNMLIYWMGNNRVRALKINKDGSPSHPLYIGYDAPLIPYGEPYGSKILLSQNV